MDQSILELGQNEPNFVNLTEFIIVHAARQARLDHRMWMQLERNLIQGTEH